MMFRFVSSLIILVMSTATYATVNMTSLESGNLNGWNSKQILNLTDYQVTEYKNRYALKAHSNESASGLIRKQRIDLSETPYLNWSWLIKNKLMGIDERTKGGDDYAARVYVVVDGGLMVWRTKALNYVWSSSQMEGDAWDNPFAGSNVKMLAIKGESAEIEQWYDEKRNIYQDLIEYFGDKGSVEANLNSYRYIDATVIMTDTDNSQTQAISFYGDIFFSEN